MNKQERIEAVAKFICDYENENPDCTTRDLATAIEEAIRIDNELVKQIVWDHRVCSDMGQRCSKAISTNKDIIKIQPKGSDE